MRIALCGVLVLGCTAGSIGASGPDGGPPPHGSDSTASDPGGDGAAACPWGAQLGGNASVGLAAVPHASGPTADEQVVLAAMNARRTAAAPLTWNGCLADLARGHSADMIAQGYFGHGAAGDPGAFMIADRVLATGLALAGHADEDLLTGDLRYYLGGDIATVVADWMMDDHKLPILGCAEAGVAIGSRPYLDTTIVWVTADFRCP